MMLSLADLLRLRYEWEYIVSYRKTYELPSYEGTIDNLRWFIDNGARNNRFRRNFDRSMELAKIIVESYENEKTNLSSIRGEAIKAV